MPSATIPSETSSARSVQVDIEPRIGEYGEKIFGLIDAAEPPSLFSRKGFYGTLMEYSMRDDHFKTQMFRFVDVLPTLNSLVIEGLMIHVCPPAQPWPGLA